MISLSLLCIEMIKLLEIQQKPIKIVSPKENIQSLSSYEVLVDFGSTRYLSNIHYFIVSQNIHSLYNA